MREGVGAVENRLKRRTRDNRLAAEVGQLREAARDRVVVLLDYETNGDVVDLSSPLSHAALMKCFVEGSWPAFGGP